MAIEFNDDRVREEFEKLRRRLCTPGHEVTPAEVFNSALTLLDWAVSEIEAGRPVGALNVQAKGFAELSLPALDNLKRQIPWGTWRTV